jgi:hypothetical protein
MSRCGHPFEPILGSPGGRSLPRTRALSGPPRAHSHQHIRMAPHSGSWLHTVTRGRRHRTSRGLLWPGSTPAAIGKEQDRASQDQDQSARYSDQPNREVAVAPRFNGVHLRRGVVDGKPDSAAAARADSAQHHQRNPNSSHPRRPRPRLVWFRCCGRTWGCFLCDDTEDVIGRDAQSPSNVRNGFPGRVRGDDLLFAIHLSSTSHRHRTSRR